MNQTIRNTHRQNGATLVVALIILVVLMIIGVMAVMTANTQSKLAGNLQFENIAKNNAENQLATAEAFLAVNGGAVLNPGFTTWSAVTPELHPYRDARIWTAANPTGDPLLMSAADWKANSTSTLANPDGYMIERLGVTAKGGSNTVGAVPCTNGNLDSVNLFQITARASTARGAVRYIQTVYQIPIC